ncbi:succinylglutamate desuccinylase/aspartoacylase family protein [Croceivirga sp. JEA036]|uniref:succinylglutamate desuccinylase/aspartoacylase family protein n=1 Tax=Croceivirga sp. JEA036 TaxID=2721162 RepID=UPI00143C058F|nr:succinylglutamate desuccinylase/aspartoacylase family protein [Croceivirga sp. JEA036]NJB37140.1 succinylglutamate desuccinylase/aspartoacylase family protein [Croceivirga sp. JEA036]
MWEERADRTLQIGGELVPPGKNKLVKIDIAKLPTGTLIDIPVHVFNSKNPGPVVLLQAGLHGDEINGVETLRRMLADKTLNICRGTVIVVPILNVFGFIHFSRDVPDGKDVNRSFPGSKNGSLASRIAYNYANELLPQIDIAIDLHTGGGQRHNHPQVRYTLGDDNGKELAEVFNAPFYFSSKLIKGSFRNDAYKKGKTVIVYEAGESMRFDGDSISIACQGITNVLHHLKMLEGVNDAKTIVSQHLIRTRWVRAPRAGMFIPKVKNGMAIKKGEIMGIISDTYAKRSKNIIAPNSGFIFCINNQAVVNQGDAIFHIGQ